MIQGRCRRRVFRRNRIAKVEWMLKAKESSVDYLRWAKLKSEHRYETRHLENTLRNGEYIKFPIVKVERLPITINLTNIKHIGELLMAINDNEIRN